MLKNACFFWSLLRWVFLTYLSRPERFRYPEMPLIFVSISHFFNCLSYLLHLLLGDQASCSAKINSYDLIQNGPDGNRKCSKFTVFLIKKYCQYIKKLILKMSIFKSLFGHYDYLAVFLFFCESLVSDFGLLLAPGFQI